MRRGTLRTLTLAFLLCVGGALSAADNPGTSAPQAPPPAAAPNRPRIGLVLGGGGARGGAHVGVLRVMEQMRIPVDYIAGTSIGSLVGALYAIGYSPDEIETILRKVPWAEAFQDTPDRRRRSFRQKQDDDLALFPFEFGFGRNGVSGKKGILEGTRINFVFRTLTLETGGLPDFDQLRIPYRAIAADLETADMVVLDHGDLAQAMRASMSVPGAFTPVEIEGRVLVDGGIARNIPVDVVRGMGADRVIAIDVGTPAREDVHDLSTLAVLSQTLSALAERNRRVSRQEIGPQDVLLTPELGNFGAGDFAHILDTIPVGEAVAQAHASELSRYSVSEEEYAEFLRRQRRGGAGKLPTVVPDTIRVEGIHRVSEKQVLSEIDTKPKEPINPKVLYRDLDRLYSLGEFQSVGYRIDRTATGNELVLEAREKAWGPAYLRFGLSVNADLDGNNQILATTQLRWPDLNRAGAEWKTVLSLGDPFQFGTEWYQPFHAGGRFFVAPRLGWERDRHQTFLLNGDLEDLEQTTAAAGLDFGMRFKNYGEIRVGGIRGTTDIDPVTATHFAPLDREIGGPRFLAIYDQLDDIFFPTHGNRSSLELFLSREGWGGDDEYDKLEFRSMQAGTLGRNTWVAWTKIGTSLGSDIPFYAQFPLGGFFNMSGFAPGSLRGNASALFSLADYWRLKRLGGMGKLYGGAVIQAGNAWPVFSDAAFGDLLYSGTLFLGLSTKTFPVYVGFGWGEGGNTAGYLVIGRAF